MCVLELQLLIQMMNITGTSGWHELCSLTEKNILINVTMDNLMNM